MPATPEERQQYMEFLRNAFKVLQILDFKPDEVLWHYTTGNGLIGIIESGTLFATQVACLNDSTEIRYAIRLFSDAVADLRSTTQDPVGMDFLDSVLRAYKENPEVPSHGPSKYFVSCLSALEDDLSQWRAYGNNGENGYSIGFRAAGLMHLYGLVGWVNYNKARHKEIAAQVAEATLNFYLNGLTSDRTPGVWTNDFLVEWDNWIGRLAPFVKDDCFAAEREFRVAHELDVSEVGRVRFSQKDTLLSRYLPLTFPSSNVTRFTGPLPIVKVIVGPGRHQAITRVGVKLLLDQMGYKDVPVELSQRPFQRA